MDGWDLIPTCESTNLLSHAQPKLHWNIQLLNSLALAYTSATIHRPFSVCKGCAGLINIAHSDILCDHVPDFNIDSILLWTCNMPVRLIWFLLPCGGYAAGTYQRKILTSFLTLPAYRNRTCHFCPRIKYGWAFLSIETYAGTLREEKFFRDRNYHGIVRVWICTTHGKLILFRDGTS